MENKGQPQLQAGDVIHADQEYYRILVLTEKTDNIRTAGCKQVKYCTFFHGAFKIPDESWRI